MRHQASIEVAEEGTVAAAATWASVKCFAAKSPKRPPTFEMIIDRPFFFAICDIQTHTMLFMGFIEEPNSYEVKFKKNRNILEHRNYRRLFGGRVSDRAGSCSI